MLFNSYIYIFLFLPLSVLVYAILKDKRLFLAARLWLIACSLFYYGWMNPVYLILIISSITINYYCGILLQNNNDGSPAKRKTILIAGLLFNILLLGYFKYTNFLIANLNFFLVQKIELLKLLLPLGISFFTFIQIAYLVDIYRGTTRERNYINYFLFVSFFPQLLSGPIVRHNNLTAQYRDDGTINLSYELISKGLFLFSLGLFKKVMIADNLAPLADAGFSLSSQLTFFDSWITSLSYTFQLYFDFSGYTDMAIGSALMFGIRLPINFNSPYKALSIQDFWRRWHITLSSFLRDYIYIPLGGNRAGQMRTYANQLITFLVAGIWHGAGWTFVFWGFLHGMGLVIHRIWQKTGIRIPKAAALLITFNFVNLGWVFFRASNFTEAINVIKAMLGLNGILITAKYQLSLKFLESGIIQFSQKALLLGDITVIGEIIALFIIVIFMKNTGEQLEKFKPRLLNALITTGVLFTSLLYLQRFTKFIYYSF